MLLNPPEHSPWRATAAPSPSPHQEFWLARPGALTAGLRKLGRVDLRVTRECESVLSPDEAWMLQQPEHSPIWLREIVMAINGVDSVFARSFTPLQASLGVWQGMRHLQTRPLADMLYNDPQIVRSPFYTCRLTEQQPMYESALLTLGRACPPAAELLARYSAFWQGNEPLLVAECFLPEFWRIAETSSGTPKG